MQILDLSRLSFSYDNDDEDETAKTVMQHFGWSLTSRQTRSLRTRRLLLNGELRVYSLVEGLIRVTLFLSLSLCHSLGHGTRDYLTDSISHRYDNCFSIETLVENSRIHFFLTF